MRYQEARAHRPAWASGDRRRGIRVELGLTDNGRAYRSRPFRKACRWLGIAARRTRPYRPQTNGKDERMIQTLRGLGRTGRYRCPFVVERTDDDAKTITANANADLSRG